MSKGRIKIDFRICESAQEASDYATLIRENLKSICVYNGSWYVFYEAVVY